MPPVPSVIPTPNTDSSGGGSKVNGRAAKSRASGALAAAMTHAPADALQSTAPFEVPITAGTAIAALNVPSGATLATCTLAMSQSPVITLTPALQIVTPTTEVARNRTPATATVRPSRRWVCGVTVMTGGGGGCELGSKPSSTVAESSGSPNPTTSVHGVGPVAQSIVRPGPSSRTRLTSTVPEIR